MKSSNKMIEDEMHDAVVLAFANTLTPSTAACPGKKLTDVRKNENLWWRHADGAGGDSAGAGGKVQAPGADGAGRGKADKGHGRGRGKGKKAGVAATLGPSSGVAAGRIHSGGFSV